MQARDEQASNAGVIHTVRFVIWRSSEDWRLDRER